MEGAEQISTATAKTGSFVMREPSGFSLSIADLRLVARNQIVIHAGRAGP
jgi:hypothetical protein